MALAFNGKGGSGGSQAFVRVLLRHSADFANVSGNAPVVKPVGNFAYAAISLPPSAFGANSIIDVVVNNNGTAAVEINGSLIVQNAVGTIWIEQDGSAQSIAAGASASIDFATNAGGAGAGLSWDTVAKQIDIADAGVYSAFVSLAATPA